jgi:hypothetical protein
MKGKMELVANVALTIAAMAVTWVAYSQYHAARPSSPPSYAVGERISTIPSLASSNGSKALLVVVRSGCAFCTASMPFYHSLTSGRPSGSTTRIIVVTPDDQDTADRYLSSHDVHADQIITVRAGTFKASGTPTLYLIDSTGVVRNVWEGQLNPSQESEVKRVAGLAS